MKLPVSVKSIIALLNPFKINMDKKFVDRNYAYWQNRIDTAKSPRSIDLIHSMIKKDVQMFAKTVDHVYVNTLYNKLVTKLNQKENQLRAEATKFSLLIV